MTYFLNDSKAVHKYVTKYEMKCFCKQNKSIENMFLKTVQNLSHFTYRSLNYVYTNRLVRSRQLINRFQAINRCLTTGAVNSGLESDVVLTERRNNLKDLDLNDKQLNDLFDFKPIDGLSEQIDYELLDQISPTIGPAFNLAAFADKSKTIQMFIKLGVDLSHIEKKDTKIAEYVLRLDFESDVKPYIHFLVDNGVNPSHLGYFLTRNPTIFDQHLDDLKVRINYLESKKFNKQMISSIISKSPKFLSKSTKFIDYKLAFIQKEFGLTADEVRELIVSYPRIALLKDMCYREMIFLYKEEFGFNSLEIKQMLLKRPVIFRHLTSQQKCHRMAVKLFDFIHNDMQIPHELICKTPEILDRRLHLVEPRHLYLKQLDRAQYDPKKPLYVPLSAFYLLEDNDFCDQYAKTTVHDFNRFCKTL